jgi:hypothetical protein
MSDLSNVAAAARAPIRLDHCVPFQLNDEELNWLNALDSEG